MSLTWENPYSDDDDYGEDYDELCAKSTSSDFYFAAANDEFYKTAITLVPKLFFHAEKCCWDQGMQIDHLLPKDFDETMEATWGCDRSLEEVKSELLSLGFEENEEFSDFIAGSQD
jgi:hypothetical protein